MLRHVFDCKQLPMRHMQGMDTLRDTAFFRYGFLTSWMKKHASFIYGLDRRSSTGEPQRAWSRLRAMTFY